MDFSPKADFAKGPSAAAWSDVAASKLFTEAAGAAMLQMQANLGMATAERVTAHCYQMEGARIFLSILLNLTTPPETVTRPKTQLPDNLDHKI